MKFKKKIVNEEKVRSILHKSLSLFLSLPNKTEFFPSFRDIVCGSKILQWLELLPFQTHKKSIATANKTYPKTNDTIDFPFPQEIYNQVGQTEKLHLPKSRNIFLSARSASSALRNDFSSSSASASSTSFLFQPKGSFS